MKLDWWHITLFVPNKSCMIISLYYVIWCGDYVLFLGTMQSEGDNESVFSANSVTNLWSYDPSNMYVARRQESTDTNRTESIELGELR